MYNNIRYNILPHLANTINSKVGQLSLLESNLNMDNYTKDNIKTSLAQNPNLDRSVWFQLVKKAKASVAYGLINRDLDLEQLSSFKNEKRTTVLKQLFHNGLKKCDENMAEFIINLTFFNKDFARLWIKNGFIPDKYKKTVAKIENGSGLLVLMRDKNLFTADEILEIIPNIDYNRVRYNLYGLFDTREDFTKLFSDNIFYHKRLIEALASSRHLVDNNIFDIIFKFIFEDKLPSYEKDDIYYSLLANPNTPNYILEKVIELIGTLRTDSTSKFRYSSNATILNYAKNKCRNNINYIKYPWEIHVQVNESPYRIASSLLGYNRYPTLWKSNKLNNSLPNNTHDGDLINKEEEIYLETSVNEMKINSFNKSTTNYICNQLDLAGKESWELFWTLLCSWEDDLHSLIKLSISINKAH